MRPWFLIVTLLAGISFLPNIASAVQGAPECNAANGTIYQLDNGDYCICPLPTAIVFDGMHPDDWYNQCFTVHLPVGIDRLPPNPLGP